MFPQHKAELLTFIDDPAPLARVTTQFVRYQDSDHSTLESIHTKFMTESIKKLMKVAPDDKFKEII